MLLTRWTQARQIRSQKRKALQLLTLSGVVRPSTWEVRYTTPLLQSSAVRASGASPSASQPLPHTRRATAPTATARPQASAQRQPEQTWLSTIRDPFRQVSWHLTKAAGRLLRLSSAS